MIDEAQKINQHFQTDIELTIGDTRTLVFLDDHFHSIIFSFNGIMSIPGQSNRDAALREIFRTFKKNGIFIFTTYDRDAEPEYFQFWKEEKQTWGKGNQRPELYEFGDLIAPSKNETRDIFIHILSRKEIDTWLDLYNFITLDTFYRSERFPLK